MIRNVRLAVASWSTFGQTALLIIAALLLAQVLSFFFVRTIFDEWQRSSVEQPAVARFAEAMQQVSAAPAGRRPRVVESLSRPGEAYWLYNEAPFGAFARNSGLETALAQALRKRGMQSGAALAARGGGFDRGLRNPPRVLALPPDGEDGPPLHGDPGSLGDPPPMGAGHDFVYDERHRMGDVLRFAAMLPDGEWLVGRFELLQRFPRLMNPVFSFQVALFVILLAGTLFWASRISRPLRILARAAQGLRPQELFEPLPVKGPRDVQVAIQSFNTMALRVRELLHEKDRMLTAIGHDLRTPLASLRIRAETVEPEGEREKIIETIDDMTVMVEEILALARLGYSNEPRELVDLSALADAVVEEFAGVGKPVVFAESPRAPLSMQAGLVRRLLRNLIDNAVKYGEKAQVFVRLSGGVTELVVEDEGPGIPPERLHEVLQPFTRLEQSRSRMTGGSGLGLTIADATARSQGASLVLENRPTGGLRAVVVWPPAA